MKELSPKTFPVGVGILFALYATNFFEEKWIGLFGIFLIIGVYAIDLLRFLVTPEKYLKEFEGKVFLAKCEENSTYGKSWLVLSTRPHEDPSCIVIQLGTFTGVLTGEVAKTLKETGVVIFFDEE